MEDENENSRDESELLSPLSVAAKKSLRTQRLNRANENLTHFVKLPIGFMANGYELLDPVSYSVKDQSKRRYFLIGYGLFFLVPLVAKTLCLSEEKKRRLMTMVQSVYNVLCVTSVTTFALSRIILEDVKSEKFAMGVYSGIAIIMTLYAIVNKVLDHHMSQGRRFSKLIEFEVLNTVDRLEANWQRILAGRQNTILAARLFEAEKRQFELGLRTSTDVLDTQTKFAEAQSSEILSLTEYEIAKVDLAFATGTLLGAARIHWKPIKPTTD